VVFHFALFRFARDESRREAKVAMDEKASSMLSGRSETGALERVVSGFPALSIPVCRLWMGGFPGAAGAGIATAASAFED
jgi:hypothetical protein